MPIHVRLSAPAPSPARLRGAAVVAMNHKLIQATATGRAGGGQGVGGRQLRLSCDGNIARNFFADRRSAAAAAAAARGVTLAVPTGQ